MDEFEAHAVATAVADAAPFLKVTSGRIQFDDEDQRNVLVELDDETALLVQKEVRWSVSVVKVFERRILPEAEIELELHPSDTDSVARETLKVARRFYFGDFGTVKLADPFARLMLLDDAVKALEG